MKQSGFALLWQLKKNSFDTHLHLGLFFTSINIYLPLPCFLKHILSASLVFPLVMEHGLKQFFIFIFTLRKTVV